MVEIIKHSTPVIGLVLEKETETSYALIKYEHETNTNRLIPTILTLIDVDEFLEARLFSATEDEEIEEVLREMLKKYVGESKIHIRLARTISLSELEE